MSPGYVSVLVSPGYVSVLVSPGYVSVLVSPGYVSVLVSPGYVSVFVSLGYVCSLQSVLHSGCCPVLESVSRRFVCAGCVGVAGCCSVYEHCVSCCLHPDKVCVWVYLSYFIILSKVLIMRESSVVKTYL